MWLVNFEVRHPHCVSQITKSNSKCLKVYQTMVTANNYMFRLLTGHHQVVHLTKRVEDCTIYNVTSV